MIVVDESLTSLPIFAGALLSPRVSAPQVRLLPLFKKSLPCLIFRDWFVPKIRLLAAVTVPPVLSIIQVPVGFAPPLFVKV